MSLGLTFTRETLCTLMQEVKVAVMTPYGTSGVKFLHGLFDQHKEVVALPMVVDVYDFYENPEEAFSPEEYLAFFEKNNVGLFDLRQNFFHPVVAEPPQQELRNIDREAFCTTFFSLCTTYGSGGRGRKVYFFLLHLAYFLERGRKGEDLKCLLVHMHRSVTTKITRKGPEYSQNQHITLFRDFPQALFLPCLRDPVQSADSLVSLDSLAKEALSTGKVPVLASSLPFYWYSRSFPEKVSHYAHLWSNLFFLWRAAPAVYLFHWTDMHRDFAGLMQHLCGCLGVQYDPSLRQATFMGNPWVGLSGKQRRTTCDPRYLQEISWQVLTEAQRALLRIYFREVLRKFFPEEVRPLGQEIMAFFKGLFQKSPLSSSSPSCKKGKGSFLTLMQWPSWKDLLCLGKICVYYWRLRHLRTLDLSHAFTYRSSP